MPNVQKSSTENAQTADNQQERIPKNSEYLKYYLAGFVDGEGCFNVAICRHPSARFRWKIDPHFQVYQHKDNSTVLYLLRDVLKCGYVSKKGGNPSCYMFCVDNLSQLAGIVIPFFESYPLVGEKYQNFLIFQEIVYDLLLEKHFEKSGFIEIVQKAFLMNRAGKYRKHSFEEIVAVLK